MPNIRIIEMEGQYASRGVALHRNKEERLLTRKLLPNEVVEVPEDHYLLDGEGAGRLVQTTKDKPTRPFLYEDEAARYLSDPRNCHMSGYTGFEDYQASIKKGGSTLDADEAADAAVKESKSNAQPRTRRR